MPDMLVKLYELPAVSPLVKELEGRGILIRQVMPYEKHQVTEWVRRTFGEGWGSECDVAFSNHPISCFIATEVGCVVGFACYDSTCMNFFGPTGVAENKRGQGIGKALFLACLHAMKAKGFAYAIIGGAGPTEFYAKAVGATIIEGSVPGIYRDQLKSSAPALKKDVEEHEQR
ncbi:MAG: GNAT family N-acetyltransferase [Candidatus Pacebacteria bacterium]|nr:GNAT family N-acetyltransferase [Candidatus Paceibacterota bacterium]